MTRTLLTAIFLTLFSQTAWAGEQESANPFAGVYFGLQHSKYNIKATATKPGASPYSIKPTVRVKTQDLFLGTTTLLGQS